MHPNSLCYGPGLALKGLPDLGRQTPPALCCQDLDRGSNLWAGGPGAKARHFLGELNFMQDGTFVWGFEE